MATQLFAVEHYDDSDGPRPAGVLPAMPGGIAVGAVYLPADQVVIALIEAEDETAVVTALGAAGWRVDRITPAAWLTPRVAINNKTKENRGHVIPNC